MSLPVVLSCIILDRLELIRIFVAPALKPGTPIPRIKLTAGRLAGKICPRLTIDNGLDLNNISRIEVEIQRFLDDPLCHAKISLQTGRLSRQWPHNLLMHHGCSRFHP